MVKLKNKKYLRRQDAPITYDMNASIYIWKRKALVNSTLTIDALYKNTKEKIVLYEMPEKRSIDIDSHYDFDLVEFLLKKINKL